uniref:Uncharacterized protein n=1 Tax=Zonotrichia albicollis TaxID=44394 RepID=A0A8D2LYR7_ZONAL
MGDEKDSWKVKTLDEILQEKKRRKEQEEKAEIKRMKNSDDRDSKRDSLEEGELRDHRMEITIRNSPYRREDSMEDSLDLLWKPKIKWESFPNKEINLSVVFQFGFIVETHNKMGIFSNQGIQFNCCVPVWIYCGNSQ